MFLIEIVMSLEGFFNVKLYLDGRIYLF